MQHCGSNQLQAAERLGISRMTLRSKLRTAGLIGDKVESNATAIETLFANQNAPALATGP